MKKHHYGIFTLLAAAIFAMFSYPVLAAETGCVKCHTNAKILSTLHKPVAIDLSEGVG